MTEQPQWQYCSVAVWHQSDQQCGSVAVHWAPPVTIQHTWAVWAVWGILANTWSQYVMNTGCWVVLGITGESLGSTEESWENNGALIGGTLDMLDGTQETFLGKLNNV